MTATEFALASMTSGEVRWIGRYDLHVHCRRPCVAVQRDDGRIAWKPGPATFAVCCPDGGIKDWTPWMPAAEAAAVVDGIAGGVAKKRRGR